MTASRKKRSCSDSLSTGAVEVCVICNQEWHSFPQATTRGMQKLLEATNARKSVSNEHYTEAIKRITDLNGPVGTIPDSCCLHWPRNCYSDFTHKVKIE